MKLPSNVGCHQSNHIYKYLHPLHFTSAHNCWKNAWFPKCENCCTRGNYFRIKQSRALTFTQSFDGCCTQHCVDSGASAFLIDVLIYRAATGSSPPRDRLRIAGCGRCFGGYGWFVCYMRGVVVACRRLCSWTFALVKWLLHGVSRRLAVRQAGWPAQPFERRKLSGAHSSRDHCGVAFNALCSSKNV